MTNKKFFSAAIAAVATALIFGGCSLLEGIGLVSKSSKNSAVSLSDEGLTLNYGGYGFQALQTDAERKLYARIDRALNDQESPDIVSEALDDVSKIRDVLEMYKNDFPGVFWIDEKEPYYYAEDSDHGIIKVTIHLKYEGEALAKVKAQFEEKIQSVLDGSPTNGSAYERELYVHNWLIDNCSYDEEAAELHKSETVRANEQNAYGAIVEGRAVCEGYARAFQLLCDRLDVPCWEIQGRAEDFGDSENANHIWNCVELEGEWYQVDVTWDDFDKEEVSDDEQYIYFNITTDMMCEDHTIAPQYSEYTPDGDWWYNGFVPQCNSTRFYYYSLNALAVDDLDNGDIAPYVAKAAENFQSCCTFVIGDDYDFMTAYNLIAEQYAYNWISAANDINGYYPQIGGNCELSGYDKRRLVTLILDYE